MKQALNKIDRIILLCKNPLQTATLYSQALGLKVYLQSQQLVELRDANNLKIFLKSCKDPAMLSKGYSPILSFYVQHFQEINQKLIRYQCLRQGQIIKTKNGSMSNFMGLDGQTICIHNLKESQFQDQPIQQKENELSEEQIKRILNKIRI